MNANHPGKTSFDLKPVKQTERKPFHFLVADDSVVNRKILRVILERKGDTVDEAINGLEVVERVKVKSYDALFLDIHMPVMGGIEAMKLIKSMGGKRATIPIFAVTGDSKAEDRERYLHLGTDGYIAKPINIDELKLELDRVLVQKPDTKALKTG